MKTLQEYGLQPGCKIMIVGEPLETSVVQKLKELEKCISETLSQEVNSWQQEVDQLKQGYLNIQAGTDSLQSLESKKLLKKGIELQERTMKVIEAADSISLVDSSQQNYPENILHNLRARRKQLIHDAQSILTKIDSIKCDAFQS
eukprot:Sdes_comp20676_c0_seq1m16107